MKQVRAKVLAIPGPERRYRLPLLVLVLLVLALLWAARGPGRDYWMAHAPLPELEQYVSHHPEAEDAALALARRRLAEGAAARAEEVLTALMQRTMQNGEGWLLLSRAEFDQGKLGPAYASLKLGLPFLGRSAEAHWLMGILLERRGDEREAAAEFQKAVDLDPRHLPARMELARDALAHRNYAPAIQHLTEIIRREPRNAAALQLLSLTYRNLGDLPSAERAARRAVSAAPGEASSWRALAQALQDRATDQSLREAEQACRKALELQPDSSEMHHQLGRIYVTRGSYAKAARELQRSVDLNPLNRMPYPALIQAYLRLGQRARAEELRTSYERVNEMDLETAPLEYSIYAMPENTALRLKLAKLYLRYKRPDLARTQVEEVLRLNPAQAEARCMQEKIKK